MGLSVTSAWPLSYKQIKTKQNNLSTCFSWNAIRAKKISLGVWLLFFLFVFSGTPNEQYETSMPVFLFFGFQNILPPLLSSLPCSHRSILWVTIFQRHVHHRRFIDVGELESSWFRNLHTHMYSSALHCLSACTQHSCWFSGCHISPQISFDLWLGTSTICQFSLQLCSAHLLSLSPIIPSQLPPTMLTILCSPTVLASTFLLCSISPPKPWRGYVMQCSSSRQLTLQQSKWSFGLWAMHKAMCFWLHAWLPPQQGLC